MGYFDVETEITKIKRNLKAAARGPLRSNVFILMNLRIMF